MTIRTRRQIATGELVTTIGDLLTTGHRVALIAAHDDGDGQLRIVYLLTRPGVRTEIVVQLPAAQPVLPSLAALSFPAGRFEREMHDLFGIVPQGHPLPHRLVRHRHWPAGWYPLRRDAGPAPEFTGSDPFPFVTADGPGVYEIPVGPVHAGLIEPGHFRFSVVGESILKLKARLWFVHRGVEKLFEGRTSEQGVALAERISGDTSLGHTLAYCHAVEDAYGWQIPEPAAALRGMLLELERLYNHVADLGALANDVGYGIANAHALRIRETLLRLNADVTGHRLLRGALAPGRVAVRSLPDPAELERIAADVAEVAADTLGRATVHDRFAGTAVLSRQDAQAIGCLGYVARASGLPIDARVEHPSAPVRMPAIVADDGDVLARYDVRRREVTHSTQLIRRLLDQVGPLVIDVSDRSRVTASPDRDAVGLSGVGIVEGWRGTITTRIEVSPAGQLRRVKPVDPSWFNWPALPVALAGAIVPDFPLVNKSFNQSYAGNDL
jgi:Ni,Fe-hydrogenase III large subunit/Ni,Fe-hydrogenase III component G